MAWAEATADPASRVTLLDEALNTGAPQAPPAAVDAIVDSLKDLPESHRARAARAEAMLAVGAGRWALERRESLFGGDVRLTAGGAWETFGRVGQVSVSGTGDDTGFTQGQAGVRAWFGRGGFLEASMVSAGS